MKQIKNLKFIKGIVIGLCMYNSLHAQYITLRGNQFIDPSGKPFYPVVCNYSISFYCNTCIADMSGCTYGNFSVSDVDLMPTLTSLDVTPDFGEGLGYIKAAFAKIKGMGFNTVRLIGWGPSIGILPAGSASDMSYCYQLSDQTAGISCTYTGCDGLTHGLSSAGFPITYNAPYNSDNNLNNVTLPKIKAVLQAANDVGLYVILNCLYVGEFSGSDADASSANNLLTTIAASISGDVGGHPELLAYDLFNEPHWHLINSGAGCTSVFNTTLKSSICQYTNRWYTSIKAVDPYHLITIGNVGVEDVMDWDPAIMTLDFNCLHPYPYFYLQSYDGYDEAKATSRYQDMLYWMSNNSPMPWIVSETGVMASNNTTPMGYDPATGLWGTFSAQSSWSAASQQIVINNSGSGYGWWEFEDNNLYGLLKYGHPSNLGGGNYVYDNTYDKPIVANAFGTNVVSHGTAQVAMPANYYNDYGTCGGCFTWSGTIVDNNNEPIKDAVIQAQNDGFGVDYSLVPANMTFSIQTFSHVDGSFTLSSPVPSPILGAGVYDYGKFDHIKISAAGGQTFEWSAPTDPITGIVLSGAPSCSDCSCGFCSDCSCTGESTTISHVIMLERKAGVWDSQTSLVDINGTNSSSSSPAVCSARHQLFIGGDKVELTGTADFHASSSISAAFSFCAQEGSYTHIYCAPVDFECSQLTDPDYLHRKEFNNEVNTSSTTELEKDITVNYLLPSTQITLRPNPAENYFCLLSLGAPYMGNVQITDALGHNIYEGRLQMDGQTSINTSVFAAGFYNVHVSGDGNNVNLKLIIVR